MKDTIICDLDGTLADLTHRLHHVHTPGVKKNWDAFFAGVKDDKPISAVQAIIDVAMYADGMIPMMPTKVIFCSGRPERCREDTVAWLADVCCFYSSCYELYMRADGDRRDDSIVKQEILDTHIDKSRVLFVLDDRQRVVDMWRRNGLMCFQVAPGDF